jgi:hypothetical protein
MAKQAKATYHVTDKRGTRTTQMTERKALLANKNGADVRVTSTSAQKRAARQWAARGISTR